jgi:hypothetical protein
MNIHDYIVSLRKEAENLRSDWLVSMAEGMCNERMADKLENIADDLEIMVNDGKV